jgi:hypothetical protein
MDKHTETEDLILRYNLSCIATPSSNILITFEPCLAIPLYCCYMCWLCMWMRFIFRSRDSKHKNFSEQCKQKSIHNYYRLICVPNTSKLPTWIMISISVSFVTLDSVARQQSCYITVTLLDVKQVVLRALSTSPFKDYRVWWSLSDSKYAGTAMFIKKKFEPKKVSFNLDRTCMFWDDFNISYYPSSIHNFL